MKLPDLTPYIAPAVFYGLAAFAVISAIAAATAPKIVHDACGF